MRSERGALILPVFALIGSGLIAGATGLIMAASDGVPAVPAIGVGTGATAVATLAWWIVRKAMSGEITPLPITELVSKMDKVIEQQQRLLDGAMNERNELKQIVKESTQAQYAMRDFLQQQNRRQTAPGSTPAIGAQ